MSLTESRHFVSDKKEHSYFDIKTKNIGVVLLFSNLTPKGKKSRALSTIVVRPNAPPPVNHVFDIWPLGGTLKPGESQIVTVK